jgi:hypothetical protein
MAANEYNDQKLVDRYLAVYREIARNSPDAA